MSRPAPESMILERRRTRIDAVVEARTRSFTLVLERIGDPHNIAAILRTCESFGIQDVHVVEHETAGFRINPKISQGCEKWVDLHFHRDIQACAEALKAQGFSLCVSDLAPGAEPLHALPLTERIALVLGNEQEGVTEAARAVADRRFVIPMLGFTQSFNVSVTAAICVSLMREKRRQAGVVGDLSAPEKELLRRQFYELAVKQGGRIYPED